MSEFCAGKQLSSQELHILQLNKTHPKDGPIVVASSITDPFNAGSILRSCEAIGSREVYFVDTPDLAQKKLLRTSRNAVDFVPHHFLSLKEFLSLASSLPTLIALEITSKSTDVFLTTYEKEIGFVVGGENQGIPEEILSICQTAMHLPMVGVNSSINVANALCVALYDWHRRFRY